MMQHDPSKWHEKLWTYYPINYSPDWYHDLTSWWLDKIPQLGNNIMEVGCWSALGCLWIKYNFPEKDVIGVDINNTIVHFARTRAYYFGLDVPIYAEDGFNLNQFADQSKDVIFHDGLAEHFPEDERMGLLREHLRVAKKVLFVVPTKGALDNGGGYGDEIPLTYSEWSDFTNKNFIVLEEFTDDENHHYGCVLGGIK